jgi:hypothetical protein
MRGDRAPLWTRHGRERPSNVQAVSLVPPNDGTKQPCGRATPHEVESRTSNAGKPGAACLLAVLGQSGGRSERMDHPHLTVLSLQGTQLLQPAASFFVESVLRRLGRRRPRPALAGARPWPPPRPAPLPRAPGPLVPHRCSAGCRRAWTGRGRVTDGESPRCPRRLGVRHSPGFPPGGTGLVTAVGQGTVPMRSAAIPTAPRAAQPGR